VNGNGRNKQKNSVDLKAVWDFHEYWTLFG